MKLIIGLGNPGEKYEKTRHNVGFMCVDYIQSQADAFEFAEMKKVQSLGTEYLYKGEKILLLKPQTFMNDSGHAVRAAIDFYKVPVEEIAIVHDDLDIPFGQFKIQTGKGPKIHNGLASVEKHLSTVAFQRVRIGVDARTTENRMDGRTYVLQAFESKELSKLHDTIFPEIFSNLGGLEV